MNRTALIFMLVTEGIITSLTIYFFIKVIVTKPKIDIDEDSYEDNDSEITNQ
jgi:hypothetical protein